MTVAEYIEMLEAYPPEWPCCAIDSQGRPSEAAVKLRPVMDEYRTGGDQPEYGQFLQIG